MTRMTSRKLLLITSTLLLAIILATSLVAAPVIATSPHFVGTPTIVNNPNYSIAANFKAAGLSNAVATAFLSSSGGTAMLQCVNPGGNSPAPKQVSFGPLQGQKVNIQPRNGQITATTNPIGPPPLPSASQICPNSSWSVHIISIGVLQRCITHTTTIES